MTSYITIEELNTLVPTLISSGVLAKVGWGALSEEDKTVLLSDARYRIDSLKFKGSPTVDTQPMKFPRVIKEVDTGIPLDVKLANASLVVVLLREQNSSRIVMQKSGVKSFSIANDLSETFKDNFEIPLVDTEVISKYLVKYLVKGRW